MVTGVAPGRAYTDTTSIEIRELAGQDLEPLAGWLSTRSDASAFQDPSWHEVVRRAYGHETRYWAARRAGTLEGAFAATRVRVPLLGSKYIGLPYQMHSGAPVSSSVDVQVELVRACIDEARSEGAAYIEIRHFEAMPYLERLGFQSVDSALVTTVIPLEGLELTRAAHGHRQRVRKAGRSGVEITEASSLAEWRLFRRMYLETGRGMGAPQAGWSFFAGMRELMGDQSRLYMALYEGRTIGGFLVFGDERGVFARCSAHSTPEALSLNVGQALWWRALTDAADAGCSEFNCGITWTGDSGLVKWKEGWGGTSRPVHTYVLPLASAAPSAGGYFEGYGLAKAVWKRLPLPVVDVLGRAVTRWIG